MKIINENPSIVELIVNTSQRFRKAKQKHLHITFSNFLGGTIFEIFFERDFSPCYITNE